MPNRFIALVVGYHEYSYPPSSAYDAGLVQRFAIVFDTYRPDKGYAYFDAELYFRVLTSICQAVAHDSISIDADGERVFHSFDELVNSSLSKSDDDREPPKGVCLFRHGRIVACAETEEWLLVGGPAPYHDSYTLSVYTSDNRAAEFQRICECISVGMGATITGIYDEQRIKEPFTPFWKRPLRWLGIKTW